MVVAGTVCTMVEPETVMTCGASVVTAVGVAFAVVGICVVVVIAAGVVAVVGIEEVPDSSIGVDDDVELPSTEPTDCERPSNQIVHELLPPPYPSISNHASKIKRLLRCLQNSPG